MESPIGDDDSVSMAIQEKVEALQRLGERLERLTAHDAPVLLHNCFALPKLMYILRTAPCFRSQALLSYDDCLRVILSQVTNTHLESDGSAWEQATLLVGLGGLGIRSAVDVAPSAYLASIHFSAQLFFPSPTLQPLHPTWMRRRLAGPLVMNVRPQRMQTESVGQLMHYVYCPETTGQCGR